MGTYMIKRLALTVPLLFVISLLAFLLVNLSPMDPAEMVLRAQEVPEITEALLEQTRERLGMDQPL
ncbi:nickel ABC transporter permease subunit NikB, partial [Escherichia coli]|nr:nickel ABC transporter permease subunit NikB [Escherichia coli]